MNGEGRSSMRYTVVDVEKDLHEYDSKNVRNVSIALHTNANLLVNSYQQILELGREGNFSYLDP